MTINNDNPFGTIQEKWEELNQNLSDPTAESKGFFSRAFDNIRHIWSKPRRMREGVRNIKNQWEVANNFIKDMEVKVSAYGKNVNALTFQVYQDKKMSLFQKVPPEQEEYDMVIIHLSKQLEELPSKRMNLIKEKYESIPKRIDDDQLVKIFKEKPKEDFLNFLKRIGIDENTAAGIYSILSGENDGEVLEQSIGDLSQAQLSQLIDALKSEKEVMSGIQRLKENSENMKSIIGIEKTIFPRKKSTETEKALKDMAEPFLQLFSLFDLTEASDPYAAYQELAKLQVNFKGILSEDNVRLLDDRLGILIKGVSACELKRGKDSITEIKIEDLKISDLSKLREKYLPKSDEKQQRARSDYKDLAFSYVQKLFDLLENATVQEGEDGNNHIQLVVDSKAVDLGTLEEAQDEFFKCIDIINDRLSDSSPEIQDKLDSILSKSFQSLMEKLSIANIEKDHQKDIENARQSYNKIKESAEMNKYLGDAIFFMIKGLDPIEGAYLKDLEMMNKIDLFVEKLNLFLSGQIDMNLSETELVGLSEQIQKLTGQIESLLRKKKQMLTRSGETRIKSHIETLEKAQKALASLEEKKNLNDSNSQLIQELESKQIDSLDYKDKIELRRIIKNGKALPKIIVRAKTLLGKVIENELKTAYNNYSICIDQTEKIKKLEALYQDTVLFSALVIFPEDSISETIQNEYAKLKPTDGNKEREIPQFILNLKPEVIKTTRLQDNFGLGLPSLNPTDPLSSSKAIDPDYKSEVEPFIKEEEFPPNDEYRFRIDDSPELAKNFGNFNTIPSQVPQDVRGKNLALAGGAGLNSELSDRYGKPQSIFTFLKAAFKLHKETGKTPAILSLGKPVEGRSNKFSPITGDVGQNFQHPRRLEEAGKIDQVKTKSEEVKFNEGEIEELKEKKIEIKLADQKKSFEALHYEYNVPDFGSVNDLDHLIDFLFEIKEKDIPLIIHCSAGVGRTGMILGIHEGLQILHTLDIEQLSQISAGGAALEDLKNLILLQLRTGRVGSIQTEGQLETLALALIEMANRMVIQKKEKQISEGMETLNNTALVDIMNGNKKLAASDGNAVTETDFAQIGGISVHSESKILENFKKYSPDIGEEKIKELASNILRERASMMIKKCFEEKIKTREVKKIAFSADSNSFKRLENSLPELGLFSVYGKDNDFIYDKSFIQDCATEYLIEKGVIPAHELPFKQDEKIEGVDLP